MPQQAEVKEQLFSRSYALAVVEPQAPPELAQHLEFEETKQMEHLKRIERAEPVNA